MGWEVGRMGGGGISEVAGVEPGTGALCPILSSGASCHAPFAFLVLCQLKSWSRLEKTHWWIIGKQGKYFPLRLPNLPINCPTPNHSIHVLVSCMLRWGKSMGLGC